LTKVVQNSGQFTTTI